MGPTRPFLSSSSTFVLVLVATMMVSACSTSKAYRQKKRNCNCPDWSQVEESPADVLTDGDSEASHLTPSRP